MNISRNWYGLGFITCISLLGIAYFYFQRQLGLAPCPLCMLQRAALIVIAAACLIGWLHAPQAIGSKIYAFLIAISSLAGALVAGRQVWLQHLPAEKVPECGFDPVFRWMDKNSDYGLLEMLSTTLKGSGDCAKVEWSFLSMSMAMWMLIIFILMFLIAFSLLRRRRKIFS